MGDHQLFSLQAPSPPGLLRFTLLNEFVRLALTSPFREPPDCQQALGTGDRFFVGLTLTSPFRQTTVNKLSVQSLRHCPCLVHFLSH